MPFIVLVLRLVTALVLLASFHYRADVVEYASMTKKRA
jgi:hypothetical protein